MKLGKETRNYLRIGDHLIDRAVDYLVTNIIEERRGKLVTVCIYKYPDKAWERHNVYAQPMSMYYGLEIVRKCKWCYNGECILRGGVADDCTCDGDTEEMEECAYVDAEE